MFSIFFLLRLIIPFFRILKRELEDGERRWKEINLEFICGIERFLIEKETGRKVGDVCRKSVSFSREMRRERELKNQTKERSLE